MYSLTCDADIMTKITEDTQDYTNCKSAMDSIAADPNFGSAFLGGQNHIALFAEVAPTIDMSNAGPYDQGCNETSRAASRITLTVRLTLRPRRRTSRIRSRSSILS